MVRKWGVDYNNFTIYLGMTCIKSLKISIMCFVNAFKETVLTKHNLTTLGTNGFHAGQIDKERMG